MNPRTLAALAVIAGLGVVVVVIKPGDTVGRESEYVIPDCTDDVTPVDCRFGGPYSPLRDGGAIWRGCNAGLAMYAVGTQCVAAPGIITAGNTIVKRGGQYVEVDTRDASVAEHDLDKIPSRSRDAGGR